MSLPLAVQHLRQASASLSPPSIAFWVQARKEIEKLRTAATRDGRGGSYVRCEDITETGVEADEKFQEVIVWARDEARKFIDR